MKGGVPTGTSRDVCDVRGEGNWKCWVLISFAFSEIIDTLGHVSITCEIDEEMIWLCESV